MNSIWLVDTSDQLTAMLVEVQKSNVFSFDFENHSMTKRLKLHRSFSKLNLIYGLSKQKAIRMITLILI
jgi:hypothetical protein